MAKLLPIVILDEEILKEIVRYYRINTKSEDWNPKEFIELECFSNPSLELHECNYRSKLLGGHDCKFCSHKFGKPCSMSCHLQTFCLAIYAQRMGIGGKEIEEAIENNLYKMKPEELYDAVIKKLAIGDSNVVEVIEENDDVELFTISEAAKFCNCSYSNIYNSIKAGVLPNVEKDSRKFLKKKDIEVFKKNRNEEK